MKQLTPHNQSLFQLKYAVIFVALANLLYFFVEFHIARRIESVSLYADSIDFLEDAAVNSIVLFSLYLSARSKHCVSILLAMLLLIPISAAFFTAWEKFSHPLMPAYTSLSYTALGALAVNFTCAFLLAKFQNDGGSLSKAAFLSSRNDAIANLAILFAALVSAIWPSFWPDLLVGLGIALINLDSAKEILESVRDEKNGRNNPDLK
ncbi:MAG: cation transporter [Methylophilaceae bacterium]|nr:cation transporter [Methylophilaceae bacterium]